MRDLTAGARWGRPGHAALRAAATAALLATAVTAVAAGLVATSASAAAPAATGRYIVRTSAGDAARVSAAVTRRHGRVRHRFGHVLPGFSATMSPAEAAALRTDPGVRSIVADVPTHGAVTQAGAPWGLDRLDQRATAGDGSYTYDTTGQGVTVFVVDSGIRFSHAELGGRASSGYDFVDGDPDASDCYGHGTHVAGTIGGADYGVAKDVQYVALRVWGCSNSGWMSDMVAALDWVVAHKPSGPAVVNISGGGGASAEMNAAVAATTAAGILVVVAAMNDNADACAGSPSSAPSALTIGATDASDARAAFSDYGDCVDLWAPGVNVLSSVNASDTAAEYWSGTSMATPHVTGAVARYLEAHPTASASAVGAALTAAATPHAVGDARSVNDALLYVAPPADTTPPQVTETVPTAGASGVSPSTNVSVTFSEPMDHAATEAAVALRRSSDGATIASSASWSGTTLVLDPATNLVDGTSYTVAVGTAAHDAAGNPLALTQTWSFAVSAILPGLPVDVTAIGDDTARTATVTWSPPGSSGSSAIIGYRVGRDGTDSAGTGPWSSDMAPTARSATFANLVAGQAYTLTVQAINTLGAGPSVSVTVIIGFVSPPGGAPATVAPVTITPVSASPGATLPAAAPPAPGVPPTTTPTITAAGAPKTCVVRSAKGLNVTKARALLARHGCRVAATVTRASSATVKAGRVIRTTPPAGTVTSARIRLVVSRGKTKPKPTRRVARRSRVTA